MNLCPKCGSIMVKRVRRRDGGSFFGCSKFPDCREARSIGDRGQMLQSARDVGVDLDTDYWDDIGFFGDI